jgi:hypothetical protein
MKLQGLELVMFKTYVYGVSNDHSLMPSVPGGAFESKSAGKPLMDSGLKGNPGVQGM